MADLQISIGGRDFDVSCQPGEEHFLRTAAGILDAEASQLTAQIGRIPDMRLLLMAGLMVSDKVAALEDQLRILQADRDSLSSELSELRAHPQTVEVPVEVPVEVIKEVTVEKEVPVEVIVEKIVEKEVIVEKVVEKLVEVPVENTVDVAVLPDEWHTTLERLAAEAEALADLIDEAASA